MIKYRNNIEDFTGKILYIRILGIKVHKPRGINAQQTILQKS